MTAKAILKRFERAKKTHDLIASVIDDIYDFCLPLRERATRSGAPEGEDRTDRLFDGTAYNAAIGLASKMLEDVWPADQKPAELSPGWAWLQRIEREEAGPTRKEAEELAAAVTDDVIETINASNFRDAAHEALLDWACPGTGVLLCDEGDALQAVRFRALPLAQAYFDTGPYGERDALFTVTKVAAGDIALRWPGADLGPDLTRRAEREPDAKVELVEGFVRDRSQPATEAWDYSVVHKDGDRVIYTRRSEGTGSAPFVDFDFMRAHGEVYGRGPGQVALSDIKSLNFVKELLLSAADMQITGMWHAEDDGVINPNTIQIAPGTIIPKMPGSEGLTPITPAGSPDLAQFIIRDMQAQVERYFYALDLGPTDTTPMSATEALQRSAERAGRLAGPNARVVAMLDRVIKRVIWIRRKQGAYRFTLEGGRQAELPPVNGRDVQLRMLAPITRAQALDDVLRHSRFIDMINVQVGPQLAQLTLNQQAYVQWLADKMGVEPGLVRSEAEQAALAQAIAQLAEVAQQAPGPGAGETV